MDPMVSARVPVGLRDAVNQGLKEIGSSPTELINSAYEFFLANRALPGQATAPKPGRRHLGAKDIEALNESIASSTCAIPESYFGGRSYDELLAGNLRGEYEALS